MSELIANSTPRVGSSNAIIVLILNIFLPGVGTMLASLITDEKEKMQPTLIVGCLQFLLSFLCIGWIWAIFWGFKILLVSREGALP